MTEYVTIMSFDIGEKNFCCYKETVNLNSLTELKKENVPVDKRYNKNGECFPEFGNLLRKMSKLGNRTFVDKVDITSKDDKKYGKRRVITNKMLVRLSNYLEDLNEKKVFDDVSYFVIEEQLKSADNNRQIQFHLRSYLLLLFLNFRPILSFSSRYKTCILGAPKKVLDEKEQKYVKLSKPLRKKWASERAFNILTDRNDFEGLDIIFTKKKTGKSDDIADCIVMTQAFLYMVFIDNNTNCLDC